MKTEEMIKEEILKEVKKIENELAMIGSRIQFCQLCLRGIEGKQSTEIEESPEIDF